jgi:hypothetical protein
MLKTISVPVLVASLLAGPAIAAGTAAKAPADTKMQAASQSVAKSDTDTSAAKKKAKKAKKVTKDKAP